MNWLEPWVKIVPWGLEAEKKVKELNRSFCCLPWNFFEQLLNFLLLSSHLAYELKRCLQPYFYVLTCTLRVIIKLKGIGEINFRCPRYGKVLTCSVEQNCFFRNLESLYLVPFRGLYLLLTRETQRDSLKHTFNQDVANKRERKQKWLLIRWPNLIPHSNLQKYIVTDLLLTSTLLIHLDGA